jgi:hypothetical protein
MGSPVVRRHQRDELVQQRRAEGRLTTTPIVRHDANCLVCRR